MQGVALSRRAFIGSAAALVAGCSRSPDTAPTRTTVTPEDVPEGLVRLPTEAPLVRVRAKRLDAGTPARIGRAGQTLAVGTGDPIVAPASARPVEGAWLFDDATGRRHRRAGEGIDVRAADGSALALDDAPDAPLFPDALHLVRRSNGGVDVVNHVAMETYLPGVLVAELYRHWHPETFIAQAIAARSFACSEVWTFRARHYDVVAGPASQAYAGTTTHETAHEAVRVSRGRVLSWRGALVPGYYSAVCGGTAARASDAIGPNPANAIPPLDGQRERDGCDDAPRHRWTIERSRAEVEARLGRVRSIEVAAVNLHGRPLRYRIVDGSGETRMMSDRALRTALDRPNEGGDAPDTTLHSSDFTVSIERGRVRLRGRGFGHGVGLCQWGAEARAHAGDDAEAILERYYPGVTIVKAW